jgi:hypothetical protein
VEDGIPKSDQRLLGGWDGQRTEAAHGRFENVAKGSAPGIISGIRAYISQHPA